MDNLGRALALMLAVGLGLGAAGCGHRGGGGGGGDDDSGGDDDDDSNEPTPAEREALEAFFDAYPEAYCNWSYRCGLVGDEGLPTCIGAITENLQGIDVCDAMVELYVQYRDELDACVTGEGNACSENDDDFCPILGQIDYENACNAAPGCTGPSDCDDGEDCVEGSCIVTGGTELTPEQAAVGAWGGSGTCDGTPIEVGWILCPAGRVRGYSIVNSYDFLDCGTWSMSGDEVSGTISATAVIDASVDSYDYHMTFDGERMYWGSCQLPLERLPGGVDETDCTGGVCSAGGSGDVECGTDCDCGRCWYCETDTCRYGGEGAYGCYRGCGF